MCVIKKVTAFVTGFLPSESPWETELFQLTGKVTGAFIYPLPIHHWLRAESKDFYLLFIWLQCGSIVKKKALSGKLLISSELLSPGEESEDTS